MWSQLINRGCFDEDVQINKIIIIGVIPLIHGGLSVLLGEYLYTRGERTSIKT